MEDSQRREPDKGLGDGFARAMELVLGPALFGLLGYWLDGMLGTSPILMVVFALAGLTGVVLRMYYSYSNEMDRHEQNTPWVRVGLRHAASAAVSPGLDEPAREEGRP